MEARGRTCLARARARGGMTSALKQIVENSLRFGDDDDSVIDRVRARPSVRPSATRPGLLLLLGRMDGWARSLDRSLVVARGD